MNIRVLNETDAQIYQDFRLNALKKNPEVFGSTYEREVNFPIETVIERLKPTKDKFALGAFNDSGSLIGTVTFMRESSTKFKHKANVFGMYVNEESRGQGIGKILLDELIRRAKSCDGLEQINLMVVSTNESAKRLYKSIGFEVYGVERNAMKYNEQYFDEDLMVLKL